MDTAIKMQRERERSTLRVLFTAEYANLAWLFLLSMKRFLVLLPAMMVKIKQNLKDRENECSHRSPVVSLLFGLSVGKINMGKLEKTTCGQ